MNRYFILGMICMVTLIILIPTDTPEPIEIPITSSTRSDWGGDQSSYMAHCGNTVGWFEWTDNNTGEVSYDFVGGCKV